MSKKAGKIGYIIVAIVLIIVVVVLFYPWRTPESPKGIETLIFKDLPEEIEYNSTYSFWVGIKNAGNSPVDLRAEWKSAAGQAGMAYFIQVEINTVPPKSVPLVVKGRSVGITRWENPLKVTHVTLRHTDSTGTPGDIIIEDYAEGTTFTVDPGSYVMLQIKVVTPIEEWGEFPE